MVPGRAGRAPAAALLVEADELAALSWACLNVNFTMMLGASQKPSPSNCSLLKERRGPSLGQA